MDTARVGVFLDYQNAYEGARAAFFRGSGRVGEGHFHPERVARILAGSRPLHAVTCYVGSPDPRRQPGAHAAHTHQVGSWRQLGVRVVARTLKYPPDFPTSRPRQKGVDVALAVDFIAAMLDDLIDVGILFSTDTDLEPPLEFVQRRFAGRKSVEAATWSGPEARRGLDLPGVRIHRLGAPVFREVQDPRDYRRKA